MTSTATLQAAAVRADYDDDDDDDDYENNKASAVNETTTPLVQPQPPTTTAAAKKASLSSERTLDDFLHLGKYCWIVLLFSEFMLLSGAGNTLFMVYAGAAPKTVSCKSSETHIKDICASSYDYKLPPNCTIFPNYEFLSVNVEFEYLCKDEGWVKSSISVQMAGVLFGTLLAGNLADRYGRLWVLSVSFFMVSLTSVVSTFSTGLWMFTAIRTVLGFFKGGLLSTYSVYKMEHVPKNHRFWIATIISWAPNYMLLSGVAYLCHDWRTYQWAIFGLSAPGAIAFFFVYESPRWLIQRGRLDEARRVLRRIQAIDGAEPASMDELEKMMDHEHKKQQERIERRRIYDMRHLFWNKTMTIVTIILCIGMFSTSFTNYGLVFNIEKLSGSLYMNALLMGSLRWATNISVGLLDIKCKKVGRKLIHFVSKFAIALCLVAIFIVYVFDYHYDYSVVIRIATLMAAAIASQVFITKNIVLMEYYPTVVRNSAVSLKSVASRVGAILAPQMFTLCPYRSLPYAVLAAFCFFDAFAFQIVLPETKGRHLPDTLPERPPKLPNKKKTDEPKEPLVVFRV